MGISHLFSSHGAGRQHPRRAPGVLGEKHLCPRAESRVVANISHLSRVSPAGRPFRRPLQSFCFFWWGFFLLLGVVWFVFVFFCFFVFNFFFVFFFFFVVLFSLSVTRKLSHCLSECYSTCFDVTLNKRTLSLCPRTQFFTEENKDRTHIGNEAPYIVCSGMSHATHIRVPGEGGRLISPHICLLLPMVWVQVGGRTCTLQVFL